MDVELRVNGAGDSAGVNGWLTGDITFTAGHLRTLEAFVGRVQPAERA